MWTAFLIGATRSSLLTSIILTGLGISMSATPLLNGLRRLPAPVARSNQMGSPVAALTMGASNG